MFNLRCSVSNELVIKIGEYVTILSDFWCAGTQSGPIDKSWGRSSLGGDLVTGIDIESCDLVFPTVSYFHKCILMYDKNKI